MRKLPDEETATRFIDLFGGIDRIAQIEAFGTGKGGWKKRPLRLSDVVAHLRGEGSGIGVGPLCPDNKVAFAAIDLDEPDFAAAVEMQRYLPGTTFLERSRSGNAHVWAFFKEPLEAWVAMGILKEATLAAGKDHVEVFPKNHDFSRVVYGNYINLPFHGNERPTLENVPPEMADTKSDQAIKLNDSNYLVSQWLDRFLEGAWNSLQEPEEWRKRARWLMLDDPSNRTTSSEFGTQSTLHMCGDYILANAETNPVVEGHRNAVFFALAKMLSNWEMCDHDEALEFMMMVNKASPDPAPASEIRRILGNAERGQYTSTGCDDPLVGPYCHPDCPIANPKR